MLGNLIGQIDWPAAAVLISLFIGSGAIIITAIVLTLNGPTQEDVELEQKKMQLEHERNMFSYETNRLLETKKLEQNLITSHRDTTDHG